MPAKCDIMVALSERQKGWDYLHALLVRNKMFLWNTMPPIMANSKEGQDHKDKFFDTSRKILSQEMTMYNMKAFIILSLRSYDQCQFILIGQMSRSID